MKTILALLLAVTAVNPPAKTLVDYFRPMGDHGPLSKDAWGVATVGPRDPKNGLEDPTLKQWYYWDGSIIKGKDGKYHLFASRWDQAKGHNEWWNSKAIHAVADGPTGRTWTRAPCGPTTRAARATTSPRSSFPTAATRWS